VLGIYISEGRNRLVAEKFISSLIDKYGKHTVYTDGGTWYPQACTFLHFKHRLHYHLKKSIIRMAVHDFKDRVESFEDYYPCNSKRRHCDDSHVYNWIELFESMYNNTIVAKNNPVQIIKEGDSILLN
jgi:putative transposase